MRGFARWRGGLQAGIEIPELDHPLTENWDGLPSAFASSMAKCLTRKVTIIVKGERKKLELGPQLIPTPVGPTIRVVAASFMVRSVLDQSRLLRVSSDLSRVKVTHHDPVRSTTEELTLDCTDATAAALWLRDGDVVEVPEK